MWIVVNHDRPSVFYFDNKDEASEKYEEYKESGYTVHIGEVKGSHFNKEYIESCGHSIEDIKSLDVKWYL